MKKILALLLCFVMLFGLVACGTAQNDTADETKTQEETATAEEKKTIKMATNAYFQPYEFYEGDKIVGIDAEIAAAIAEKLGMELEILDMEFDTILTAVKEGKADFGMAGMTVTDKRKEEVDFTTSYANGVQSVIVKEDSAITKVDDLFADGATWTA
ncbi:MAG: transporter substrate-binding domain-containing protein, partial [Clostridia bacterium]|nr:transporter substrate-binding domain-containing protein [Clostridia bacterium]